ncbi:MAG TPA: efflux RND transporter periplasmic adaptor subunit [Woeseiaceae bacterium]|nr:efflux RND transporter periplasmic adaptor subunit [Woeseiaceae bacterium]
MIKRLALVLAFLALVFGSVFGWKYLQMRKQSAASAGPTPAVVSTRPVTSERWQPVLEAIGSITPTRGVVVSAEVPGIVRKIYFDSGQHVEEGELLVELDVDVDRAELDALKADRRLAEITRNRVSQIVSDNLGPRSELDEAQATLDRTEAEIAAKQAMIRKKSIRTPFAGELGIRIINPGQYLAPGDEIVQLVGLDPIYAEYSLPERFLSELHVGQDVTVRVQAYPESVFEGSIYAISPSVQTASRSVRIRALIENADRRLRPGMFAEVDTLLDERDSVLTLPERAVTYNPYGESVFVVNEADGKKTVALTQIKTGQVRNGRVEVLSGLDEGTEVVSDGHNKLRNGQAVSVDNSVDPDALNPRQ